jgi:cytochrome c oxidase assembly factor CtaG
LDHISLLLWATTVRPAFIQELHATRAVLARVIWLFLTAVLHLHAFVRLFNMDGLLYNDHCSCSICIASVFFSSFTTPNKVDFE